MGTTPVMSCHHVGAVRAELQVSVVICGVTRFELEKCNVKSKKNLTSMFLSWSSSGFNPLDFFSRWDVVLGRNLFPSLGKGDNFFQ